MLKQYAKYAKLKTQTASTITVPAPIGGWNARDSLGSMAIEDAVTLTNWWPGTNSVILRNGYTKHATGMTGQVESVMTYASGSADKLFAAVGQYVYNITSSGAVGAADLSSLTNAKWQSVNFTNTGGSYLMMVNGAD